MKKISFGKEEYPIRRSNPNIQFEGSCQWVVCRLSVTDLISLSPPFGLWQSIPHSGPSKVAGSLIIAKSLLLFNRTSPIMSVKELLAACSYTTLNHKRIQEPS